MGMNNPYAQYRQTSVQTASQGALILMLYDGAIKNLNTAHAAAARRDHAAANQALQKAQAIVTELMVTLNYDAGDVARRLYNLYEYYNYRLVQANIKKDPAIIEEVRRHLQSLRQAWEQAARQVGSPPSAHGGINIVK